MKLAGKQKHMALTILGASTSFACGRMYVSVWQLDSLLKLLDVRFKYDKATELLEVFEEYFSESKDRCARRSQRLASSETCWVE